MNVKLIASVTAACLIVLGVAGLATAQTSNYTVSAPYTYKNLSIFLIHGKDE